MSTAMHPPPSLVQMPPNDPPPSRLQMPPVDDILSPAPSPAPSLAPSLASSAPHLGRRHSHASPPALQSPSPARSPVLRKDAGPPLSLPLPLSQSPSSAAKAANTANTATAALSALSAAVVAPPHSPVSLAPRPSPSIPSPAMFVTSSTLTQEAGVNRRPSRRRTGPLSAHQREKAALIRKLGACNDCRRRRVACHPSHHNMTWDDVKRYNRTNSPLLSDMVALSPAPLNNYHQGPQHLQHSDHPQHQPCLLDRPRNGPSNHAPNHAHTHDHDRDQDHGSIATASAHIQAQRYGHGPTSVYGHDRLRPALRPGPVDRDRYSAANVHQAHHPNIALSMSPLSNGSNGSNGSAGSNGHNGHNGHKSHNGHSTNGDRASHRHSPSAQFRSIQAHGPLPTDPMDVDAGPGDDYNRSQHDRSHYDQSQYDRTQYDRSLHDRGHDRNGADGTYGRPMSEFPARPPAADIRPIRTPLPSIPDVPRTRFLSPHPVLTASVVDADKRPRRPSTSSAVATATAMAHFLTSSRGRYAAVEVLLLHWYDDPFLADVAAAVEDLARVWQHSYGYSFRTHAISSPRDANGGPRSAWRWLSRLVIDFAEDRDRRDVLKIVYYNGYSYLDANRDMVLASSPNRQTASTIRWSGIQQILEEACADTLIILDAPYYPSSRIVRRLGVLELVAACVSEEQFEALGRCTFTRALIEQLRISTGRPQSQPLTAAELHATLLSSYPKLVCDRSPEAPAVASSLPTPLLIQRAGSSYLPSIFLTPLAAAGTAAVDPAANSTSTAGSGDQHHLRLSFRLSDNGAPNLDSWLSWLRLIPSELQDVRMLDALSRPCV